MRGSTNAISSAPLSTGSPISSVRWIRRGDVVQVMIGGLSVIANGGVSTTVCTGLPTRSQGGNVNFLISDPSGSDTCLAYVMENGTLKYNSMVTTTGFGTVTYNIE